MKNYLKYMAPFFFVASSLETGSADVSVTNSETAAPSPTANAGAMPDETTLPTSPYAAASPEENTYPPIPPERLETAPVAPSSPLPTSEDHGQATMTKEFIEILTQNEAILEKASQELSNRRE